MARALSGTTPSSRAAVPPARGQTPRGRGPAGGGALPLAGQERRVIVAGASTGGPNALAQLLRGVPPGLPVPLVAVVHLPVRLERWWAK